MTEETRSLVIRQDLTPANWQMIMDVAPVMAQSRLFKMASPEQAAAVMLKGYELGLSLTASFEFVHVIDGKPSLSPRGMLALVQQSPNFAGMKIEDAKDDKGNPQSCRVWMKRQNGFEYTVEFSMDDAQRAGLVKPGSGWEKYPANMLRWRAVGYCVDVVFPDVIGGMKRADELGVDITPEGDVWEGQAVEVKVPTPPPVEKAQYVTTDSDGNTTSINNLPTIPDYGYTLDKLLESIADEEILVVTNGEFPVTPEQVNVAVHKLVEAGKMKVEEDDGKINS